MRALTVGYDRIIVTGEHQRWHGQSMQPAQAGEPGQCIELGRITTPGGRAGPAERLGYRPAFIIMSATEQGPGIGRIGGDPGQAGRLREPP